ncbi:hypothetical protein AAHC03_016379 [Spirometra sp. Aus1]
MIGSANVCSHRYNRFTETPKQAHYEVEVRPRQFEPITLEFPYQPPHETSELSVQVQRPFSPVSLEVRVDRDQQPEAEAPTTISRTNLDVNLAQQPSFAPVTMEIPYAQPGVPARFTEGLPESANVQEGVTVQLAARIVGEPRPEVCWLKNGQPLQPSQKMFPSLEPDDRTILTIVEPTANESGVYTAIVQNPSGRDETSIQLNVNPAVIQPTEQVPKVMSPTEQPLPPQFMKAPVPLPQTPVGDVIECPGTLEVTEGVPTVLEVQVIGRPEPLIEWFVNDRPVRPDYKHKLMALPEGTHCMTLESPSPINDTGRYRCVATNPYGTSQLVLAVKVEPKRQPKPQPPKFLTKPQPTISKQPQEPVVLEATFEGSPPPIISWHKDGKLVSPADTPGERVQIRTTENSTSLIIANLLPEDIGTWQCLASSTSGTATFRTKVQIEEPRRPSLEQPKKVLVPSKRSSVSGPGMTPYPEIRQPPMPVSLKEGEKAHFSTMITSNPPPVVEWYVNGQLVVPGQKVDADGNPKESTSFDGLLHHLCIQNCRLEDAGQVTVEARRSDVPFEVARKEPNAIVTATAPLEVLPAPSKVPQLRSVPKPVEEVPMPAVEMPAENIPPMKPPQFTTILHTVNTPCGNPTTFKVEFIGEPLPVVVWYKDGLEVLNAMPCEVTNSPNKSVLQIPNTQPQDAGVYSAVATNPAGKATTTSRLNVTQPLGTGPNKPPSFIAPLPEETIQCPEGSSLSLTVEATGVPLPKLNWFRNGAPLVSSPDMQITEITPAQHRLEVNELFLTDSSELLVEAVNPFGRAVTKATLVVTPDERKRTEPPVFVKSPPPQFNAPETSTVRIECAVKGLPKPKLRWFHNNVEITPTQVPSPRQTSKYELVVEQPDDRHTVYVHNVNPSDAGEYIVRAENELGVSACKTTINVKPTESAPIHFLRPLPEKVTARPGYSTTLECEVDAIAPVTFSWYVNGLEIEKTSPNFYILEEVNRSTLTIQLVPPEMLPGEVTVAAQTPDGASVVSTTILQMQVEPSPELSSPDTTDFNVPLHFTQALPEIQTVTRSQSVLNLEVAVSPTPVAPVFCWYVNGTNIDLMPPDARPREVQIELVSPTQSRMIITEPDKTRIQEVTCQAFRADQPSDTGIKTTCHLRPESQELPEQPAQQASPLRFVQPLEPLVSTEAGSTVVLQTTAESVPLAEITWVVNQPETAQRCEIIPLIDQSQPTYTTSQLVLHNFTPQVDDGVVIQAIARNAQGQEVSTSCNLKETQPQPTVAHFTQLLQPELQVPERHQAVLECTVESSQPPVDFKWYVNGLELGPEMFKQVVIGKEQFRSVLSIECVQPELAGLVSVEVLYPQGKLVSTCNLEVLPEEPTRLEESRTTVQIAGKPAEEFQPIEMEIPVVASLSLVQPLLNQTVQAGQPTLLACQVTAPATELSNVNVTWAKDGQQLDETVAEASFDVTSGVATLIIRETFPSDEGVYTCDMLSQNLGQTVHTEAFLEVISPKAPETVIQDRPLPVTTVAEHHPKTEEMETPQQPVLVATQPVQPQQPEEEKGPERPQTSERMIELKPQQEFQPVSVEIPLPTETQPTEIQQTEIVTVVKSEEEIAPAQPQTSEHVIELKPQQEFQPVSVEIPLPTETQPTEIQQTEIVTVVKSEEEIAPAQPRTIEHVIELKPQQEFQPVSVEIPLPTETKPSEVQQTEIVTVVKSEEEIAPAQPQTSEHVIELKPQQEFQPVSMEIPLPTERQPTEIQQTEIVTVVKSEEEIAPAQPRTIEHVIELKPQQEFQPVSVEIPLPTETKPSEVQQTEIVTVVKSEEEIAPAQPQTSEHVIELKPKQEFQPVSVEIPLPTETQPTEIQQTETVTAAVLTEPREVSEHVITVRPQELQSVTMKLHVSKEEQKPVTTTTEQQKESEPVHSEVISTTKVTTTPQEPEQVIETMELPQPTLEPVTMVIEKPKISEQVFQPEVSDQKLEILEQQHTETESAPPVTEETLPSETFQPATVEIDIAPTAPEAIQKEDLHQVELQVASVTPEKPVALIQPEEEKAETTVTVSETHEVRQTQPQPQLLQPEKTEVVPAEERQELPRAVDEQISEAPRSSPEKTIAQISQSDVLEEKAEEIAEERPEVQEVLPTLEQTEASVGVEEVRQPEIQLSELTFLKPLQAEVTDQTLELECQIQTDLQPVKIKWLHDGQELRESAKYETTFFEELGTARLTVKEAGPVDAGEYACVVTRDVLESADLQPRRQTIISQTIVTLTDETVETEVEETVKTEEILLEKESGPSSPVFEVELAPVRVTEGEEIYLSAVVKGVPQPLEVIWKHNGVVLHQDTSDSLIYYLPDSGLCELTISEAFPEDAGVYEVEAQNPYGMAVSQTEVLVDDAQSVAGSSIEITSPLEEEVIQTATEPEILVQPTEESVPLEVVEGSRQVETTSVTSPAVAEGRPVVQTAQVQGPRETQPERTEVKVQLQTAEAPVAAATSAEASAVFEHTPSTDVTDAAMPKLALIQDLHPTTELLEDRNVQLMFEVTQIPETSVTWFKGEQVISTGEHYVVEFDRGVGKLTIVSAKFEDSGLYRSQIQTPAQQMELQLPLNIPGEGTEVDL